MYSHPLTNCANLLMKKSITMVDGAGSRIAGFRSIQRGKPAMKVRICTLLSFLGLVSSAGCPTQAGCRVPHPSFFCLGGSLVGLSFDPQP